MKRGHQVFGLIPLEFEGGAERIRTSDLGFRKPIPSLSGVLTYRTFAQKRAKTSGRPSQAFSHFLAYLLY
jgi:hypothetical protein